jgi:GR25 family glycosyltransferase involved in LPS biosynthesis
MKRLFSLISIFCLSASTLVGGLFDHLKKIEDKEGHHSMCGIDFIYTINLDQRPEKFAKCSSQLNPYGIYPYRFSAVNGWELTLETINDVGVKYEAWMTSGRSNLYLPGYEKEPYKEEPLVVGQTYFCDTLARGPIGIALSHLSILQDAYDSGYNTIWVMEDDIEVLGNPQMLSYLINQLDKLVGKDGWDILFTDQDTKNSRGDYVPCSSYHWRPDFLPSNPKKFALKVDLNTLFRQIGARYGAYSMIVRRSGMKKLLNFYREHQIYLPYDMDYIFPEGIRLFTLKKDLISTQVNAITDNGAPNYLNKAPKN